MPRSRPAGATPKPGRGGSEPPRPARIRHAPDVAYPAGPSATRPLAVAGDRVVAVAGDALEHGGASSVRVRASTRWPGRRPPTKFGGSQIAVGHRRGRHDGDDRPRSRVMRASRRS